MYFRGSLEHSFFIRHYLSEKGIKEEKGQLKKSASIKKISQIVDNNSERKTKFMCLFVNKNKMLSWRSLKIAELFFCFHSRKKKTGNEKKKLKRKQNKKMLMHKNISEVVMLWHLPPYFYFFKWRRYCFRFLRFHIFSHPPSTFTEAFPLLFKK